MNKDTLLRTVYHTPLFHALYGLFCSWHVRCDAIPKRDRFTIGQKVENLMLEILVAMITAYHAKEGSRKLQLLTEANTSLECLKILIRLAKDVHALDKRWYLKYEEQLQEVGKMLGGWMSSIQKANR
jgi:hypothetical protein